MPPESQCSIIQLTNRWESISLNDAWRTICRVAASTGLIKSGGNFHSSGSRVATEISLHEPVRLLVYVSLTPCSVIASRRTARSATVFAIGPAESKFFETGTIPACGTSPIVGFIVYKAALPAGHTKDPSVSVPIDIGAYPAETATAEPEDDPEGLC